jgi:hypothetical protein
MARLSDYAFSITIVVAGCFVFWIWKVTSAGGTIGDGVFVAFTWAIPAAIAAIIFMRSINRGKVDRSPEREEDIEPPGKIFSPQGKGVRCTSCGKKMRYSFSKRKWVCDKCQISREAASMRKPHPPQEKPKTGVGSEAWEANRLREIRELREKERKKAAEWRKTHADA